MGFYYCLRLNLLIIYSSRILSLNSVIMEFLLVKGL